MAGVSLAGVTKRFDDTVAVDDVTLEIEDQEFLVLLGPSGCGKSTLLRLIAGLEDPTEGEVCIDGLVVNDVPPSKRDVAMVFQSYALYPHKTVQANIEVPLRSRKIPAAERAEMVAEAARALDIGDYLDRKPAQLSGGQRQRVALARAIVRRPAVFLMDEPLSNLDATLRVQTRAELVDLHDRIRTTFVYVTHDQVEAMTMADRVAVIQQGRLQQVGTPSEVYDRPANTMVARFIGSPPMNLVAGRVGDDGIDTAAGMLPLPSDESQASMWRAAAGREVHAGFRPEHVALTSDGALTAKVVLVEALGHERLVHCVLADGDRVAVRVGADVAVPIEDDSVTLQPVADRIQLFDAESGAALP
jgi:multiple sugar transport system ATP-binding protein